MVDEDVIGQAQIEAEIENLMMDYKSIKAKEKELDKQSSSIRLKIQAYVQEHGEYKSELGSATIVAESRTVSYDNKIIDGLMQAWLESKNDDIQTCGNMLKQNRVETTKKSYLLVK